MSSQNQGRRLLKKGWQLVAESSGAARPEHIQKVFSFRDFGNAFAFMTQVAMYSEKKDHHPDWSNVYNVVTVRWNTHEAGGRVTEKDWNMAEVTDSFYDKYL